MTGAPLPFNKMEAVGNDFVLVREMAAPGAPWCDLARRLCERRFGIGADGLLVVGDSDRADLRVRMFNPDGTEDHCGNGMRCAALYWVGDLKPGAERRVSMETLAGVRGAMIFHAGGEVRVETEMGEPAFAPADLPIDPSTNETGPIIDYPLRVDGDTIPVTVVSTGTTHTVIFADEAAVASHFDRLSPLIEHHPLYPERTSVLWAIVAGSDRIRLRIWERGVGETLGCGTGACAAMIAARLHRYVGDRATVISPGGALEVFWPGKGGCTLTGTARTVFTGRWTYDQA